MTLQQLLYVFYIFLPFVFSYNYHDIKHYMKTHWDLEISGRCVKNDNKYLYHFAGMHSSTNEFLLSEVANFYLNSEENYKKVFMDYFVHKNSIDFQNVIYLSKWRQFFSLSDNEHHSVDIYDLFALSQITNHHYILFQSENLKHPLKTFSKFSNNFCTLMISLKDEICFFENSNINQFQKWHKLFDGKVNIHNSLHSEQIGHLNNFAESSKFAKAQTDLAKSLEIRNKNFDMHSHRPKEFALQLKIDQEQKDVIRSQIIQNNIDYHSFEQSLQSFGLKHIHIPGHYGNCGWTAILYGIDLRIVSKKSIQKFRSEVADQIIHHKELYQAWSWYHQDSLNSSQSQHSPHHIHIPEEDEIITNFPKFILNVESDQWLNEITIHAICDLLCIRIVVFDPNPNTQIMKTFEPVLHQDYSKIVYLYHINSHHFDALRKVPLN